MGSAAGKPEKIFFLTTLGTSSYKEVTYRWGEGALRTEYAPEAAAVSLFGEAVSGPAPEALLLVTPEAQKAHGKNLAERLQRRGLEPRFVVIPQGRCEEDFFQILAALDINIPEGTAVAADITHSFRHLSLAWLAALLYLQELKQVRVVKVTYGAFELREEEVCPLLDLTAVLHFIRGFHAARSARQAGDFRDLAGWMKEWAKDLQRRGEVGLRDQVNGWRAAAKNLAEAYHRGLPLETGLRARQLLKAGAGGLPPGHPLSRVVQNIRPALEKLAVAEPAEEKKDVVLDEGELQRQLHLVGFYLEQGNVARCLRILREWLVNWVLWKKGKGSQWLDREARQTAEHFLHALSYREEKGLQASPGAIPWRAVADLRNRLAHGGYTRETLDDPGAFRERITQFVQNCRGLLKEAADLPPLGAGRLLLSPLGLSPGPLYTLLSDPGESADRLVVFTSREGAARVDEITERAAWRGERLVCVLSDPFGPPGDGQDPYPNEGEIRAAIAASSRVLVNWTGGTAYMGWLLQKWSREARYLGAVCRHLLLVDRRPAAEQAADPWRRGEIRLIVEEGDGPILD